MTDIRLPGENGLKAMLVASILTIFGSMVAIYFIILQMELQKTLTLPNKLEFEEEDNEGPTKEGVESNEEEREEVVSGRMVVSPLRKVLLFGLVSVIVILCYSMLVLSEARSWISWIGLSVVLFVVLSSHIQDEVRRQRLDRLSAILSFVLLLTMALQLAVYSSRQVFEGQVFEGRARIVGYNMDQYDKGQGQDSVTRTDLTVAWGGSWGCPNHHGKYCTATLHGALCEVKEENNRKLADGDNADEEVEEQEDEALEEEVEELDEENQDLEDEEEVDEEVIDEYEDYTEDLEDEVEEGDYTYYYDDDMFYDGYWDEQDWDQVWGEYACEDLFAADLTEEGAYDRDTPAGQDDWPFVNIYGNCEDCTADLVNFYSTQYFNDVQNFKKSARNYGLAAGLSFVITILLAAKQRFDPTADKEIELLSRHGPSAMA